MSNRTGSYDHGCKAVRQRKKTNVSKKRRKQIAADLRSERQAQQEERMAKHRASL